MAAARWILIVLIWAIPVLWAGNVEQANDSGGFSVRLTGSLTPNAGFLQVDNAGTWGSVCADGWSKTNADLLCRQLGFFDTLETQGVVAEEGFIWLNGVRCLGHENNLNECSYDEFGTPVNCHYRLVVAVTCNIDDESQMNQQKREDPSQLPALEQQDLASSMAIFIGTPSSKLPVNFHATLVDVDGDYLLQDVTDDQLAYSAGFRDGDKLIGMSATNIEKRSVQNILNLLRTHTQPYVLLEVYRGGDYVWILFKLVLNPDGKWTVEVVQTIVNDVDELPDITTGNDDYVWLGRPVDPYEIRVAKNSRQQLYLTIMDEKLKYRRYRDSKIFYRYNYVGGPPEPGRGNVVIYSTQAYAAVLEGDYVRGTMAADPVNDVYLTDFTKNLLNPKGIPANPRFWFVKRRDKGAGSLESLKAADMYMNNDTEDLAVLSKIFLPLQESKPTENLPPTDPGLTSMQCCGGNSHTQQVGFYFVSFQMVLILASALVAIPIRAVISVVGVLSSMIVDLLKTLEALTCSSSS